MLLPPPKPRCLRSCDRCGLASPADAPACVHCDGKSDADFARLLAQKRAEAQGSSALGMGLLAVAALLAGFMLAAWLL